MGHDRRAIPEREINGRKISVSTEDNAQVLLDFGESVFGVVTTGFTLQQYRNPAFELYGSHGTIQMTGDDWGPEGYELWQNEIGAWQIFKETNVDWHWTDGLHAGGLHSSEGVSECDPGTRVARS
jgi:predicted dehydrogenase